MPADIVDTEALRMLSGKSSRAALCRWAEVQGIPILQGADGPFTTSEALNQAMGVRPATERGYRPEDIA